jgi:hypothetical protein
MFLDALTYPIRRSGWIMIIAGAIFSLLLDFLQFAPLFGLLALIFSAGYFGSFYLDMIRSTMDGRDEVPDWPSFTNFWDDILLPFAKIVALVVIAFGPLIALFFIANRKADWFETAFWAAVAWGCFYFPMAVLAEQGLGGIGTALPHVVLPAIFRSLPGYALAVVTLVIAVVALHFGQKYAAALPYIGWFLTAAVSLYALMFQARLIGLIYREKRDVLGWE